MTEMTVCGRLPFPRHHEQQQFRTLLRSIKKVANDLGDWLVILTSFTYHHSSIETIENDYDWNGEFDVVLIAKRHIVIYEMKAKPAKVCGATDHADWTLVYVGTETAVSEPSYFDQISKQRVFFLREFLDRGRDSFGVSQDVRFDVDARLLFPGKCELEIRHKLPIDVNRDGFENDTLPSIADIGLRDFLAGAYQPRDYRSDKLYLSIRLDRDTILRLKAGFAASATPLRTAQWFSAIRTPEIREDLVENCGSERMILTESNALAMADQLGLGIVLWELLR